MGHLFLPLYDLFVVLFVYHVLLLTLEKLGLVKSKSK